MVEACCGCTQGLPVKIDLLLFIFFPSRFGFVLLFILTCYCYGSTAFNVGGLEGHS
jgi:hypothetical protein